MSTSTNTPFSNTALAGEIISHLASEFRPYQDPKTNSEKLNTISNTFAVIAGFAAVLESPTTACCVLVPCALLKLASQAVKTYHEEKENRSLPLFQKNGQKQQEQAQLRLSDQKRQKIAAQRRDTP